VTGRLRDDADFRRDWAARIASLSSSIVTAVALPLLVYRLDRKRVMVVAALNSDAPTIPMAPAAPMARAAPAAPAAQRNGWSGSPLPTICSSSRGAVLRSRADLTRLATVVTVRIPTIAPRETEMGTS